MPSMTGRIAIVQEGRFQLTDDHGASHLFILGPNAAETRMLVPLQRNAARVTVTYKDAARLIGMQALAIDQHEPGEPARNGAA